ncbi:MAG: radical SAM family heme chaperone HemW [Clostridia bacterium]
MESEEKNARVGATTQGQLDATNSQNNRECGEMQPQNIGLYIHIPFCQSKCIYCDFVSSVCSASKIDEYIGYLCKELRLVADKLDGKFVVDTIYIGGGTPSILTLGQLRALVAEVRRDFVCNLQEFTMEANPNSLDLAHLDDIKALGITRVSLGAQTLNDKLLRTIGRLHSSQDVVTAIKALVGKFDTSVDCMLGLPTQTQQDVIEFVTQMTALNVGHMSCYCLSVESGTQLEKMLNAGKLTLPTDDETADMYDIAYKLLSEKGYSRYEVSNFARPNKESKHNMKYWTMANYLGVGVSAHSFVGDKRFFNSGDKAEYYDALDNNRLPYLLEEKLTIDDKKKEKIMLALRLSQGLDVEKFEIEFCTKFDEEFALALKKHEKMINYDKKTLKIKEKYMCMMNSIILDFV